MADASSDIVVADPEALKAARAVSMIQVRIGNNSYPAKHDPRCKVCTHPGRSEIEYRIMLSEGYKTIAEWVSNHETERYDGVRVPWPTVTAETISKHYRKGHSPLTAQLIRDLQSVEVDYEQVRGRIVDVMAFAKGTVALTQERVVRGEIKPDFKDGLAAAKLVAQVEMAAQEANGSDLIEAYNVAFERYFKHAQDIMTAEQWSRFGVLLSNDPILRRLTEQANTPDVQDADIVEEPHQ